MSRWRNRAARKSAHDAMPRVLGLGLQGLAWLSPAAAGKEAAWQTLAWDAAARGPQAVLGWLQTDAPGWSEEKAPVHVCLAPGLVQHWVQAAPEGVATLAELHAVAAVRAQQLFGSPGEGGWMVTADWRAEDDFVCAAVPAVWRPVWEAMHVRWGRDVHLLTPLDLCLTRWREAGAQTGWRAVAAAGRLYVLRQDEGKVVTLRALRWPRACTPQGLEALAVQEWRREMLRAQSSGAHLHWLALHSQVNAAGTGEAALLRLDWAPQAAVPPVALDAPEALQAGWCAHQALTEGWYAA